MIGGGGDLIFTLRYTAWLIWLGSFDLYLLADVLANAVYLLHCDGPGYGLCWDMSVCSRTYTGSEVYGGMLNLLSMSQCIDYLHPLCFM